MLSEDKIYQFPLDGSTPTSVTFTKPSTFTQDIRIFRFVNYNPTTRSATIYATLDGKMDVLLTGTVYFDAQGKLDPSHPISLTQVANFTPDTTRIGTGSYAFETYVNKNHQTILV